MTYACSYEVPAPEGMYREVRRLIGDDTPAGLVAHLVVRSDTGLRHLGCGIPRNCGPGSTTIGSNPRCTKS